MSRDIIDLAMMIAHWGSIPERAWAKVKTAYGEQVLSAFRASSQRLCNREHLRRCLQNLHMDEDVLDRIQTALGCRGGTSSPTGAWTASGGAGS